VTAPLYTTDILRLAASVPHGERLAAPMATSSKRSPICGSEVTVDVTVDEDGRVADLGMLVRACALGQASASVMAQHAIGRTAEDLAQARDALAAWLGGEGHAPDWPGLQVLAPALPHSGRHASIRLPFEAIADAGERAAKRAPAR
jgi:NifU-like protein involved in Fe-S cluster formation